MRLLLVLAGWLRRRRRRRRLRFIRWLALRAKRNNCQRNGNLQAAERSEECARSACCGSLRTRLCATAPLSSMEGQRAETHTHSSLLPPLRWLSSRLHLRFVALANQRESERANEQTNERTNERKNELPGRAFATAKNRISQFALPLRLCARGECTKSVTHAGACVAHFVGSPSSPLAWRPRRPNAHKHRTPPKLPVRAARFLLAFPSPFSADFSTRASHRRVTQPLDLSHSR